MAYMGKLRLKGVAFSGFWPVYERVGICVGVYEKRREIYHFGWYKGPKGLTDAFHGCEREKKTS